MQTLHLLSAGDLKEEEDEDEDEDDEDDDNEGDGDGDVVGENEDEEEVDADSEKEEEAHLSVLEQQRLEGKVGREALDKALFGKEPSSPNTKGTCSYIVSAEAQGGGRHCETGRQAAAGPGGRK